MADAKTFVEDLDALSFRPRRGSLKETAPFHNLQAAAPGRMAAFRRSRSSARVRYTTHTEENLWLPSRGTRSQRNTLSCLAPGSCKAPSLDTGEGLLSIKIGSPTVPAVLTTKMQGAADGPC